MSFRYLFFDAGGALGMRTIHFTTGERLAGQLAALGVAA